MVNSSSLKRQESPEDGVRAPGVPEVSRSVWSRPVVCRGAGWARGRAWRRGRGPDLGRGAGGGNLDLQ